LENFKILRGDLKYFKVVGRSSLKITMKNKNYRVLIIINIESILKYIERDKMWLELV